MISPEVRFPVAPLHELHPTPSHIARYRSLKMHHRMAIRMSILRKRPLAANEASEPTVILSTNPPQPSLAAVIQVRNVF